MTKTLYQANSYTCAIIRTTRKGGGAVLRARSKGEKDEMSTRKKVSQREGGRWTSGESEWREKERATYRGGGMEDNKCQNNDLTVAGRWTTRRIVDYRGQNSLVATLQFDVIEY